ncbi:MULTISPECIES: putrescine-ornithine antiporter [Dermabacter]|uniref:Putrescine transporter n=2 Tax=Dermabacter TaxID=36739 RepID=A0ABR4SMG2_9MICO|nr:MULTISPECIES: putrescine-ornithine antiporter [Dermabacter]KDS94325.1 putrescine transporter [Dermabacter hominis 1368]HBH5716270.1 putrescine-ornithine antiporter [Enterococcus faecium]ATH97176.1 putrescine-ornithine antiporter [Dermabacter jinjuensis]EPH15364.1 basic amino acid/polyamine antiporter (APA) family transporter [Dermabacter sp. HFH0086]MCT1789527.1 putrescine-ornithine antiporter [Dermabacter hominis]
MNDKPVQKKMGVVQLTILTMVNMMGSGIIMLPTKLAQIGTISILSWIVTAGGATILAYCFAKLGRYSRNAGGMGGYAEYAFGKSGSFMANYTYILSLGIANIAIAISAVGYGLTLFDIDTSGMSNGPLIVGGLAIATMWLATVLNFGGASITGKIGSITVWGVIAPVLGICIIGWFWFSPSTWAAAWNPHDLGFFKAVSSSIAMTLWAFLGLESASANSDAVENPEKNVPIAVMGGTLGAAVMYILSTNVVAGIVNHEELAASNGPFGLAFAHMFNPVVGRIITALMVIACFGSLLGWQFTIAEVARSMAKVGQLPRIFNHVTKAGAPIIGMCIITGLQTLLSFFTMSPSLAEQFEVLVNLAVITNLIPYLLSMGAVKILQKRSGVPAGKARAVNVLAFIAALYSLYSLFTAGEQAMMGGALVTFFGWTLFGVLAPRLLDGGKGDDAKAHEEIEQAKQTNSGLNPASA